MENTPPKKIYLELNNIPPCTFGALWYDADVFEPAGENCVAYVLESDVAKLERATAPASKNPSVGVYYRDGKPCKRKPRNE